MEENVFLIKWYGPFHDQEKVKEWEEKQDFKCSLYLLHGKKKYAKTKEVYYCGKTTRSVYKRFCDRGHHIEEIKQRPHSIYVGYISNIRHLKGDKINLAEKIITAFLAEYVGDESILNATNKLYPSKDVFVINEWWKENGISLHERQPHNAPSSIVPDVLTYHYKGCDNLELYGCRKLKRL